MIHSPESQRREIIPSHEVLNTGSLESLHFYPLKSGAGVQTAALYITEHGPYLDREFMVRTGDGDFLSQRKNPELSQIRSRMDGTKVIFSAKGHEDLVVDQSHEHTLIEATMWNKPVTVEEVGLTAAMWIQAVLGLPEDHSLVRRSEIQPRQLSQSWIDNPEGTVSLADGYPILLTSAASLDALNQHLPQSIPVNRFRPNIVVKGFEAWEEDKWEVIQIGDVIFDVVKPCARCPIPSVDQATGERPEKGSAMQGEPLKTLARIRSIKEVAANAGDNRFNDLKGGYFGWNLVPRNKGIITLKDQVKVLKYRAA